MPYAILRFQKRKAGSVAACERHNERKKEAYKSNPDIDMERSRENYHLVAPPRYTYKKEINRMTGAAGCRVRRDSVMLVETLITASPEFMNSLPPAEQRAYFAAALDFISGRVGKQNIISAVVHMDEKTPHMHLCFVPITKEGKLSAKTMLGNQKSLSEWQTAYHAHMSARWPELERGESSMITKRKHIPTWLFKLGGRLDIFNYGRRFYEDLQDTGTYLDSVTENETPTEIYTVEDLLNDIENAELLKPLLMVDKLTLQITLLKMNGYSTNEIVILIHLSTDATYKRIAVLKKNLKKFQG